MNGTNIAISPELPTSMEEILSAGKRGGNMNLIEEVNIVFLKNVVADAELRQHLRSVSDGESQTGKCSLDNVVAAQRVARLGKGYPAIDAANLSQVQKALNVVLRRYKLTKAQRLAEMKALSAPAAQPASPVPAASVAHTVFNIAAE